MIYILCNFNAYILWDFLCRKRQNKVPYTYIILYLVWVINTTSLALVGLYFGQNYYTTPSTIFILCRLNVWRRPHLLFLFYIDWTYGKVTIKSIMPPCPEEVGTHVRRGGGAGFAKGLYPPPTLWNLVDTLRLCLLLCKAERVKRNR